MKLPLQDELQFLRVRSAKQEIMVSARMSFPRSLEAGVDLQGICGVAVRLYRAQRLNLDVHAMPIQLCMHVPGIV